MLSYLSMATAPCKIPAGIIKKFTVSAPRASGNCTFHSFGPRSSGFEFSRSLCFLAPLLPSGSFDMYGWGQRGYSFLILNFETINRSLTICSLGGAVSPYVHPPSGFPLLALFPYLLPFADQSPCPAHSDTAFSFWSLRNIEMNSTVNYALRLPKSLPLRPSCLVLVLASSNCVNESFLRHSKY